MDQIKIGRFISERRRAVNLTQMQLAEMLNITDRAVSKWECGKAMPDSSIMLALCDILKITVNDLLNGEVVTMENHSKKMETTIVELVKEKESKDRLLLIFEWVIGVLSLIVLMVPIILGALLPIEEWQRVVIVFSGFVPGFAGFMFCTRIEQVAGYYECRHCGHKHVPTYLSVNMAMHIGRTRYMKCPKCGKRSWQKKVISKD